MFWFASRCGVCLSERVGQRVGACLRVFRMASRTIWLRLIDKFDGFLLVGVLERISLASRSRVCVCVTRLTNSESAFVFVFFVVLLGFLAGLWFCEILSNLSHSKSWFFEDCEATRFVLELVYEVSIIPSHNFPTSSMGAILELCSQIVLS